MEPRLQLERPEAYAEHFGRTREGACGEGSGGGGDGGLEEILEYLGEATKKELVSFIGSVSRRRAPEIFRVARKHKCWVERTPPHVPELQPIEYVWNQLKPQYNRRYDNAQPLGQFLETFFAEIAEETLLRTVARCDEAAVRLADPEEALLVYDDDGGGGGLAEEEEGDDLGLDAGEMWG